MIDDSIKRFYSGKKVVVTGGCGAIGKVLVKYLLCHCEPRLVISFDQDESGLFYQMNTICDARFEVYFGDVRSNEDLRNAFQGADCVFHLAASKNVPIGEISPLACISVNVAGTTNVITASKEAGVEVVVLSSSDKAVNPVGVMGATKLLCERLFIASPSENGMKAVTTRFGNVLWTSGSVATVFEKQAKAAEHLTLTSPVMSRFMMTANDAIELLLETGCEGLSGEIFIARMPSVNLEIFAEAFCLFSSQMGWSDLDKIQFKITGSKYSEKMHEELMYEFEVSNSCEYDKYFIVNRNSERDSKSKSIRPNRTYSSATEKPLGVQTTLELIKRAFFEIQ